MTEYILTAQRFDQALERDEKERITKLKRHRRGDIVTGLDESEARRLLEAGAIAELAEASSAEPDVDSGDIPDAPRTAPPATPPVTVDASERPANVAPKPAWVEYAIAHGIGREQADELSKAQIAAAVDAKLAEK